MTEHDGVAPHSIARLTGLVALLVGAIAALTWMGNGPLAAPPVTAPAQWGSWAAGKDAATIAFALGRLLTLALAWYLLGATVIGLLARLLRSTRLVALADLVTLPAVRRVLQSALGVGFAAAALTAGSSGPALVAAPTTVAAATLPPDEKAEMAPISSDRVAMTPLRAPAADPPGVAQIADDSRREWVVAPGDHFWSIAEQVLSESLGRPASDEETTAYWGRLIAANRSRLADPANPDLILPGQRFRTPPP